MPTVAERDLDIARQFYLLANWETQVKRYSAEMDAEIRDSLVKTALYTLYRNTGIDPVLSAMNACRRAPGAANTDRHFGEKSRHRMNTMGQRNLDKILKLAHDAGVKTQGKVYVGGLGKYTDQHAWVSSADDVLAVAKQRNLTVSGAVNHQGTAFNEPPKKVPLAPDIVQRHVNKILHSEPETAERIKKKPNLLRELKERVIAKHSKRK